MKPIHIFRAGRHTDMSGQTVELTEADVAACAAAYDPAKHEAPFVVGHPTHDAPAYGWVQSLAAAGSDLDANPTQIDPAFAELVQSGRFKKRSAAFYRPDSPGNPVPGVYYLHHVGFLGALPPAVKGLREVRFGGAAEGIVMLGEYDDVTNAGLWRRFREWLIGKYGQEEADKVVPSWDVQSLEQSAQDELREAATEQPDGPQFSEPTERPVTEAEAAALRAENERLKADLAADARRRTQDAEARRRADAVAFADSLIGPNAENKARLAAKHRDTVIGLLMLAGEPAADGGIVQFGEGDQRRPALDALKAMLSDLPPALVFGEQATVSRAAPPKTVNPLVADAERRAAEAKR